MRRNAFFTAGETEVFFSCGLDTHAAKINFASLSNVFSHFQNMEELLLVLLINIHMIKYLDQLNYILDDLI